MIPDLKPYPEYEKTDIDWLPKKPTHWNLLPGRACYQEKKVSNSGMKESTVLSLSYGRIIVKPEEKLRGLVPESFETYQVINPGDIICRSTDLQNDRVSLRFGIARNLGIITSAYICFRTQKNIIPEYGYLLFHAYDLMKIFYGLGSGLRQNLSWTDFKYLPTLVPPPEEQEAIVRFLDYANQRISKYIRNKQKLIKLVAEERRKITNDILQSNRNQYLRLGVVVDKVERPIKRQDDEIYTPIGMYNRGRGIFHKEPTLGEDLGDSSFYWIAEGDLVLSGQFAWEGAIAISGKEDKGCIASHRYPILQGKPDIVQVEYLWSFFRTKLGDLILNLHSRGAAGRNRPLNARTLLKEKLPIPPIEDQLIISDLVRLEKDINQQVKSMTLYLKEFQSNLVADVVTGQLSVLDAKEKFLDFVSDIDSKNDDLEDEPDEIDDLSLEEDEEDI